MAAPIPRALAPEKDVPVHTSVSPLPARAKPGVQLQVAAPAELVLPDGQGVQDVAPALL